ncbi:MAG: serine protease Do [Parvicella sp.]|jgi:serine protease Do
MMKFSKKLIFLLILTTQISWLIMINSCSGFTREGVKERAEENSRRKVGRVLNDTNKDLEPREIEQVTNVSPLKEKSLSNLFKENKPSVFLVYTTDGEKQFQGSGFFVTTNGVAVSNYHVFENTKIGYATVQLYSGERLRVAQVLKKSKEYDYIIFKVEGYRNRKFLSVANVRSEIGEKVFAIGNPKGLEHTLSEGIVSGYREGGLIQITAEITNGSSGGPLFNSKGEVMGITTSGFDEANLNFAIDVRLLELSRYF